MLDNKRMESKKSFIPPAWKALLLTESATMNHSKAFKWNTFLPQSCLPPHTHTHTKERLKICNPHPPKKDEVSKKEHLSHSASE